MRARLLGASSKNRALAEKTASVAFVFEIINILGSTRGVKDSLNFDGNSPEASAVRQALQKHMKEAPSFELIGVESYRPLFYCVR